MNRKALHDAELYARTGRLRTPSPTPSSDKEADTSEFELEEGSGEIQEVRENKDQRDAVFHEDEVDVKLSQEYVILSSDSEEEFCECEEDSKESAIAQLSSLTS